MSVVIQSRDSDFGVRVDFAEQGGLEGVPKDEQPAVIAELRTMQRDVEAHLRERRQIETANDTDERKQKEITVHASKTAAKWDPIARKTTQFASELASVRAAAADGMVVSLDGLGFIHPKQPERTIGEELRLALAEDRMEGELKAKIANGEHLRITADYLTAVMENSNPVLVRVVENAPEQYPLVSRETRAKGLEIKIARSSLAPTVTRLSVLHTTYEYLLACARQEIGAPERE